MRSRIGLVCSSAIVVECSVHLRDVLCQPLSISPRTTAATRRHSRPAFMHLLAVTNHSSRPIVPLSSRAQPSRDHLWLSCEAHAGSLSSFSRHITRQRTNGSILVDHVSCWYVWSIMISQLWYRCVRNEPGCERQTGGMHGRPNKLPW